MATATSNPAGAFVDALVALDFDRALAALHPEVDFRAMTPKRIWEAEDAAAVGPILRTWFDDPDETTVSVEATEPWSIARTIRVGWRARLITPDGPRVFEQQAYVRERDGRIGWIRILCTGKIPPT